ncbi:MAG: hypothetical protein ACT4OF_11045 [Caulobacteraceae bacterium]
MLNIALGLFVVAALFGLYLASRIFRNALPPWPAAILHGLFAASGLVVLLYAAITSSVGAVLIGAAVLLVIAALGGFFMLTFHLKRQPPPKAIVVIHAGAAVLGVAAILGDVLGMI